MLFLGTKDTCRMSSERMSYVCWVWFGFFLASTSDLLFFSLRRFQRKRGKKLIIGNHNYKNSTFHYLDKL